MAQLASLCSAKLWGKGQQLETRAKPEGKRGVHVRDLWMNASVKDAVNIAQAHGGSALRDN